VRTGTPLDSDRGHIQGEPPVGGHGPAADALVVAVPRATDRSAEVLAQRDAGGEGEPDGGGSDERGEPTFDVGVHDDREQAVVDRQTDQHGQAGCQPGCDARDREAGE